MSEPTAPKLNKLPFLIGDALLLLVAGWLVYRPGPPPDWIHNALVASCVALGAWLSVWPFLTEFSAQVKFAEATQISSAVEQIQHLQTVGDQVADATARWQTAQESADKTAKAAADIAERITTEARNFTDFMQKAQAAEVRHLQLEVEKLHRVEGDWLQVTVRMLDHVFALYSAALRAGQPGLVEQLSQFQAACRDSARRVGLTPFEVPPGSPFDGKIHQLTDEATPDAGSQIEQTLAPGFTFQGQLLRRALVTVKSGVTAQVAPVLASGAEGAGEGEENGGDVG